MGARNKKPIDREAVRIFGCDKCSLLMVHHPLTSEVECPTCKRKIDVYSEYRRMCFAEGIKLALRDEDVARILDKLDA